MTAVFTMVVIGAISACTKDDAVNNSGVGSVQASQVVATSECLQDYYSSQYSFDFNEYGLLSSIRSLTSDEMVTYEYGPNMCSTKSSASTGTLESGQVLMTIRQADTYVFHLLFSIGRNGYANSCVETNYEGVQSTWKFSYNADGYLVKLNDDGDIATFQYDINGKLISHYDHDCSVCEVSFSHNDALCAKYPENDDEWFNVICYDPYHEPERLQTWSASDLPNSLGLLTVLSDFDAYDPEFKFAYLAGLIGKSPTALPSQSYYNHFDKDVFNEKYRYLYLMKNGAVRDVRRYEIPQQ